MIRIQSFNQHCACAALSTAQHSQEVKIITLDKTFIAPDCEIKPVWQIRTEDCRVIMTEHGAHYVQRLLSLPGSCAFFYQWCKRE
jgi:hypothetical protein